MAGNRKDSASGVKLIQHKHCAICGKAQLISDPEVCSEGCKKIMDENAKKKRMWWIYMAVLFAVIAIFIVTTYFINY